MKYAKTEAGQLALKERSPQLTSRQRSAMILFDGKKTVDQVLAATAGLGIVATDIDHLLALGFLVPVEGGASAASAPSAAQPASPAGPSAAATPGHAPSAASKSELFSQAWPVATRLTATLGLRGFRLNVAVERCMDYDELLTLLPKITEALGPEKTRELREALRV
jgi:hypothetical protein